MHASVTYSNTLRFCSRKLITAVSMRSTTYENVVIRVEGNTDAEMAAVFVEDMIAGGLAAPFEGDARKPG